MDNEEYEQLKKICEEEGCFLPEDYEVNRKIADTPMYIRYYFIMIGKQ